MYPYSFVEPYPDFYRQIADFAGMAASFDAFRSIRGYTTYESVFEYFEKLESTMLYLEEISRKELAGISLNEDEIEFLGDMLILLNQILLLPMFTLNPLIVPVMW